MNTPPETTQQQSEPFSRRSNQGAYEPLVTEKGWRIGGPDWRKPWPKGLVFLSWFGAGFSYHAPGTVGSLNALPMAIGIAYWGGSHALLLAALIPFLLGMLYVTRYLKNEPSDTDPKWIVVDEVVGLWIALAAVPLNFLWYLIGFGLFRFADTFKPWPVNWVDRNVPGALGVMLDDVLAGLYAAGVLLGLQYLWTTYVA